MAERAGETNDYITNLAGSEARTAPSLQLYVTQISDSLTALDGPRIPIGALQGYSRNQNRAVFRRTELDSVVPGQAIEIIPLATTSFTIIAKRVLLNTSTMLEALGYSKIEDLMLANTPLLIEEVAYRKLPDGTHKTKITRFHGCVIKSNPVEVDITGEWMIVQECEFEVAYCEVDPE